MSSSLSPLIMYDRGPLNHITSCQERLYLCLTDLHRDKAQASVILSNLDVFSGGNVCLCAARPPVSWDRFWGAQLCLARNVGQNLGALLPPLPQPLPVALGTSPPLPCVYSR